MSQGKHTGVQAQPLMRMQRLFMRVKPVAEQWVTDRQHVHPQLVRAPGDGGQFDAAVVAAAFEYAPEGQRMLAQFVIDHMPWLGRRVVTQRQVDAATVLLRLAPAQRGVSLFRFAVMKLTGQLAVRIGIAGEHDEPGGLPVQAVHDAGFGVAVLLQAGHQAVAIVFGPPWHGEQQGRLVDHQ